MLSLGNLMFAEEIEFNQSQLIKKEMKAILVAAQQAPTGDNCQHWKFKFH